MIKLLSLPVVKITELELLPAPRTFTDSESIALSPDPSPLLRPRVDDSMSDRR